MSQLAFLNIIRKFHVVFILVGLIAGETFIQHDFECPCEIWFRIIIFILYLVTPATIAFTVTFYIASIPKEETPRSVQSRTPSSLFCSRFLFSLFSGLIWVALFFSDGRYVACLETNLKNEYADSSPVPSWEWCDKTRSLTPDQNRAYSWFYYSKITGFSFLLLMSLLALMIKCSHPYCHQYCDRGCQDTLSEFCDVCCDECCPKFPQHNPVAQHNLVAQQDTAM